MSEEKWLRDVNSEIDRYIDIDLWSLERLAVQNDVEVSYILERYRDKMTHRINKILKEGV